MNSSAPMTGHNAGPAVDGQDKPSSDPTKSTCTVTPIASEDDFNQQISAFSPTCLAVIYFHAPWAEPCKQMSTILSTLASTYPSSSPPRIAFLSLDAEEVSEISENYDVTQVPLVVLQKDGKVVDSVTGTDASKLRYAIEQHAGAPTAGNASKLGLPPAQKVTKPGPSESLDQSAKDKKESGKEEEKGGSTGGGNLSKSAPGAEEAQTAPDYSSGEVDGSAKEEFENDPEFMKEYSVASQGKLGGMASAEKQAQPV